MSRLAVGLAVAWLALGCGGDPPDRPVLFGIPEPDLARMEPAVSRQLAAARRRVEELEGSGLASAPAYGELGRLYHAYLLDGPAEACYRRAIELAPDQHEWHYDLAFLLATAGQTESAAVLLRRFVAAEPEETAALIRLGRLELELGDAAAARGRFEAALAVAPSYGARAAARAGLGEVAFAAGDLAAAVLHLETALELQPQADLLHYRLALAYRELGDEERSRWHLERRGETGVSFEDPRVAALDRFTTGSGLRLTRGAVAAAEGRLGAAAEELRRAVAADPENLTARLDLARALARAGDRSAARRELEAALELAPEDPVVHEALGALLAEEGLGEEALSHLERAVALDPSFEAAHYRRAVELARLGDQRQAVEGFTRVLELNPQQLDARQARATAWLDLGDPAAARRDLESVVEARPDDGLAHLRLAEAAQRLNDAAVAERHYRIAAGLELDSPERALAHFGLANLLARRGALEAAISEYRLALELDRGLSGARLNLAGSLVESGRLADGVEEYRALVAENLEQSTARRRLADLLLAMEPPGAEEALGLFRQLGADDPTSSVGAIGEATALGRLGRYGEARARLESELERSPQSAAVANALARLLAACPETSMRDGERALELALAAVAAEKRLEYAETLAMAFAETGRFAEAVAWQREVIALAGAAAGGERLARLEEHLARYERGAACCIEGYR